MKRLNISLVLILIVYLIVFRDWFFTGKDLGLIARCDADLKNISEIIIRRFSDGKLDIASITEKQLSVDTILPDISKLCKDPWGRFYQIKRMNNIDFNFAVFSLGADGIVSEDDRSTMNHTHRKETEPETR